jgi:hypothetical protein
MIQARTFSHKYKKGTLYKKKEFQKPPKLTKKSRQYATFRFLNDPGVSSPLFNF